LALAEFAPPETVTAEAEALLQRYPKNLAAVSVRGRALLEAGDAAAADAETAILRANPDGLFLDAAYLDVLAEIDVALGRLDDAYANYAAALDANPALLRSYARSLSALGFLPLSNAPDGVLTALRRCLDVKKSACRVSL
jgi:tetratricopeptide (TPR) repeat protein